MAPRHTAAPAIVGAHRPVAFGDVGGSGLIVVVIVAAWALFLVPQWMHRRASAAQHLADRIPSSEDDDTSVPARRFGRRELARSSRADSGSGGFFSRWRLPALPSLSRSTGGSDSAEGSSDIAVASEANEFDAVGSGEDMPDAGVGHSRVPTPRSAAARRRRVLIVLALATLLTALVVGVAALALSLIHI